ncbi:MAG TPA: 1-deoxy-D-xylulose-5-phosphate reductoisomerase [Vicinamibacterales bacterium]|nr:1-deoxy-D-xylulose-5-phosphate reductoisomerase [Vicinamibacterales bacterium]
MSSKRRIAILGSTGSIGRSALSVVDAHADRVEVVALAAGNNVAAFAEQVARYRPRAVAMASGEALDALELQLGGVVRASRGAGSDGMIAVATHPDVDFVLCASSGTAALEAVLAAIESGKAIGLANKEVLVMAGGLVMDAARRRGVSILPVDSEHNAIHQCLHGRSPGEFRRLILTASGGPFRGRGLAALEAVTAEDALKHPTWQMGPKITIDSATLMNKGLEVIEAHWLFGASAAEIDVVVHPQSIVHSLVELTDGSIIAQMGTTDMRLPIQYAFSYPDRWEAPVPFLDLVRCGTLEFHTPAWDDFPCLGLAYRALEAERSLPVVLNAANEVAVASFLEGRLRFTAIARVIAQTMDAHAAAPADTLEGVRQIDRWAHEYATELVAVSHELAGRGNATRGK